MTALFNLSSLWFCKGQKLQDVRCQKVQGAQRHDYHLIRFRGTFSDAINCVFLWIFQFVKIMTLTDIFYHAVSVCGRCCTELSGVFQFRSYRGWSQSIWAVRALTQHFLSNHKRLFLFSHQRKNKLPLHSNMTDKPFADFSIHGWIDLQFLS